MDERYTDIQRAVEALRRGDVVAIPTDTVYGLAASLESAAAIEKLFEIKGREATKAIPVLVDGRQSLSTFALDVPSAAKRLADAFWPGALTIVLQASSRVPASIHRGAATVGLRMPDSDIALSIIATCGGGLAVTSANLSGEPEARSALEVRETLGDRIGAIVDGGSAPGGKPSTVVDLTGIEPRILRQGLIPEDDIRKVVAE